MIGMWMKRPIRKSLLDIISDLRSRVEELEAWRDRADLIRGHGRRRLARFRSLLGLDRILVKSDNTR